MVGAPGWGEAGDRRPGIDAQLGLLYAGHRNESGPPPQAASLLHFLLSGLDCLAERGIQTELVSSLKLYPFKHESPTF